MGRGTGVEIRGLKQDTLGCYSIRNYNYELHVGDNRLPIERMREVALTDARGFSIEDHDFDTIDGEVSNMNKRRRDGYPIRDFAAQEED